MFGRATIRLGFGPHSSTMKLSLLSAYTVKEKVMVIRSKFSEHTYYCKCRGSKLVRAGSLEAGRAYRLGERLGRYTGSAKRSVAVVIGRLRLPSIRSNFAPRDAVYAYGDTARFMYTVSPGLRTA